MAKTEPWNKPEGKEERTDSVRHPESSPNASQLERMTELTRRILGVPKDEANAPAKRRRS